MSVRWARPGGHPVHPALAHFPIALWTLGVAADLTAHAGAPAPWGWLGFVCQAGGVATGSAAILAGLLEYVLLPREHPAQATAMRHMLWAASAWSLFATSLALRGPPDAPTGWSLGAALAGLAAMLVAGWLGGRLVYHFGVGTAAPGQNPGDR